MGENAREDKIMYTLYSLQMAFDKLRLKLKCNLADTFVKSLV